MLNVVSKSVKFFESDHLQTLTDVPMLPKAGFSYILQWKQESGNEKDYHSDWYRWVQDATKSVMMKSGA